MVTKARAIGDDKERLAGDYLKRQGLKLLERNFSCRHGEIDLIMRDRDTLVFVEVRFRRSGRFGRAAETVTASKRRRLSTAAALYLQKNRLDLPCRFDVVGIEADDQIDWIRSAFDAQ